ncbi:MAG: hypothetical protein IRZ03_19350 [Acidobacterium ailaaui]|nr:hypothetical protein [Pseudacidobacterium ailaaui]
MRIINFDTGRILIDEDQEVSALAEGVDLSTVDVSTYRLHADVLADVYDRAGKLKTAGSSGNLCKTSRQVHRKIWG